jgi:hypothetical protein
LSPQPARIRPHPGLERIRQLWQEFHAVPFPRGSAHPAMEALHRQLSEHADRITAAVDALLRVGPSAGTAEALHVPAEFVEALAMASLHGGPGSRDASVYHEYAQQLRQFAVIVRVLMSR